MRRTIFDVLRSAKRALIVSVLLAVIVAPIQKAEAGQATGLITVTATVLTACLLGVAALPFGNYDPTSSSALTNQTSITALCTVSAPYTIALNNGGGSGADATAGPSGRKMTVALGTATLGYNLYQDNSYTTLWGASSQALASNGNGLLQSYNIYGRVPAQQTATFGVYTDVVTATLNF